MARILMVTHGLALGGSPISMLDLMVGFRQQGHMVEAVGREPGLMAELRRPNSPKGLWPCGPNEPNSANA